MNLCYMYDTYEYTYAMIRPFANMGYRWRIDRELVPRVVMLGRTVT